MKKMLLSLSILVTVMMGCEEQTKEATRRTIPGTQKDSANNVSDLNWDGRSDRGNDVISVSN